MNKDIDKKQKLAKISKTTIIASASFIVLISLLMIMNFLQVRTLKPVENNTIDKLVEQLEQNPQNDTLREQIRVVDLMSRKAYFSSKWQLRTGGYFILASFILILIAFQIYNYATETKEKPRQFKLKDIWNLKQSERKMLYITIATLSVAALFVAFTSDQYYTDFNFTEQTDDLKNDSIPENKEQTTKIKNKETTKETKKDTLAQSDTIKTEDQNKDTTKTEEEAVELKMEFPSASSVRNNHSSFRGPYGLGISYKKNIPTKWDGETGENILWKKPIGLPGLNSPVIWGNYLFISGANSKTQKVYCYNRLTGGLIWAKEVSGIPGSPTTPVKVTNDTGHAAPTLATDGNRVFAIFATGDIVCFDFKGNQLWARNLGVPDNHYGHSSSLVYFKDKLIIQYDNNKTRNLMALSIYTGETIWNTERPGRISWASPIVINKGETATIIVNNEPYVAAYNADDGKELWKVECLTGEIGPSPAYANGIVYGVNEYAKLAAIKNGSIVWENYDYLPDASSPVAYKSWLFVATSYGELACLNASDGSELWMHEFDNGFYGSPVIVEDKLYIIDRMGITRIVEASSTFKLIGECKLGEKSDGTPAFANDMIYIRGKKNLYCIGIKE